MTKTRTALLGSLAALTLLGLAACSKVNPDNYAKISAGMTREEIHALLGAPDDASGGSLGAIGLTTETWKGSKHTIAVTFAGDKATIKTIEPVP